MLPSLVTTIPLLRLLPVWLSDTLEHFLGMNRSMDAFHGRSIENKPKLPNVSKDRKLKRPGSDAEGEGPGPGARIEEQIEGEA